MSIEPNSNHYDKDKLTSNEEEKEDKKDVPGYEENNDFNEDINTTTSSVTSKEQFRARMIKLFIVVVAIFLIILLIGYLVSLLSNKNYSYSDLEEEMIKATKSYFKDNESKLPSKSESVYITTDTLINNKYMKSMNKYIKDEVCTGKVVVKNISNSYDYTAYLDCGKNYQTRELYKDVVNKDKIVSSGYGLYYINDEYIYRGQYVNNYVAFKDKEDILWRIVKVLKNNEIVLIKDEVTKDTYIWDERYNSKMEYTSGINSYKNSSASTHMDKLYQSKYKNEDSEDYSLYGNEDKFLNKKIKTKLKKFNACVGIRSEVDTTRDGSIECQTTYQTKISLLSTYDFMNASIDPGCSKTTSPECQNYNYLAEANNSFWLANGKAEDSSRVYYVAGGSIESKEAANDSHLRPVIHINNNVMIEKGKGSKTNPYIIR